MPYRKILRDVKLAAIRLHRRAHLPLADILDCLQISESTFYRILQLWKTTGDVVRPTFGIRGRPQIMHFDDIDYLKRLIGHRPDWFLDELHEDLRANFIRHMAQYRPEQLGFLNEVLKDERTLARLLDGMVSNTVVEGSMTKNRFQEYLEHSVVPASMHTVSWVPKCPGDGQCPHSSQT
ncbi:hypothetical protein BJV77DRAFT_1061838 [Russula vinacea]|nr:hypothetical protein BJV77DRAFT_1061838 [Russula vinacea]